MAQGLFTLRQVNQAIRQGAWSIYNAPQWVEYLCVAGGGGSGSQAGGGGGGGGGLLTGMVPVIAGATLTVTVGAGGAGGAGGGNPGIVGDNSVFSTITANGGGRGSTDNTLSAAGAGTGGSGGGGNYNYSTGAQGTSGQGNAGGNGGYNYTGGGGGGAGTIGLNAISALIGGTGGAGIASAINGTVTVYSGGGGAGAYTGVAGLGGVGGGGAGSTGSPGGSGTTNTGGGGAGGGSGATGGSGGSGIVIVRYPGSVQFYTGGTVWAVNGYVVHRFLATGTLTPTTPAAATAAPTVIGQAFQGGYYAGMIAANGSGFPTHYLVVAPAASGQSTLAWKNANTATTGADSIIDGPQNTADMVAAGNATVYPAANWADVLSIGGYTDWYLPAQNELEVCYFFLKNVSNANYTAGNSGSNENAVAPEPISTVYTSAVPAQTTATAFQVGNAEAFASDRFWSSTETPSQTAYGRGQYFTSGLPGHQNNDDKTASYGVRAVRRVAI